MKKSKLIGIVFFLMIGMLLYGQDTGPRALRDTTPVVAPPPAPKKKVEKKDTTHIGNFFKEPVTPDEGIFDVYEDDDKVYFAIPNDLLEVDMLLVTRIAEIPSNLSHTSMLDLRWASKLFIGKRERIKFFFV